MDKKIHHTLVRCILMACGALVLAQCSDLGVRERRRPVVRLAKPDRKSHARTPYAEAYRHIAAARKLEKPAPLAALRHYIAAARLAYGGRDAASLRLYNHAVGQVADIAAGQRGRIPARTLRVVSNRKFPLAAISDILPSDCLKHRGWRTVVARDSVGAPVVVRRPKSGLAGIDKRLAIPTGLSYAATAVLEFPRGKAPVLRFYDPTVRARIIFKGKSRPLSYHLTAPLAVSLEQGSPLWKEIMLKWFGVVVPMRFVENMQLYASTPFDPGKIPVVLVHGLKADPVIWHNVTNELMQDADIRKRYQFFAFYYPTGLPLRVPGAALKKELNKLYGHYARAGRADVGKRMVVVGHSLGGLLTSVQVRQFEKDLIKKIFHSPVEAAQLNERAIAEYEYLVNGPKPHFIRRVVFVATPHRGSRNADFYLARLLASLVQIPKNLLLLKVPETSAALTDFGRSIFGAEQKQNSLALLQSQCAKLKFLGSSPVYKHIRYHSIMGDRGRGDTPDSTDGWVSYRSAHLDGAESELVVPSRHNAYDHPQAIREIRRILRKHLGAGRDEL